MEVKSQVPRDFYLTKKAAGKHGITRGCGGCSSWYRGLGKQEHTEKCRARFRELLKDDIKVKNAEARKREFEEREERREETKLEKKEKKREREEERIRDEVEKRIKHGDGGDKPLDTSNSEGYNQVGGPARLDPQLIQRQLRRRKRARGGKKEMKEWKE